MEDKREQSEFNMAIGYLNRINYLFYSANEAALALDAFAWFHSLITLFRELSTEMTPKEVEDFDKEVEHIQPQVATSINNSRKTGINEISPDLFKLLHHFEMKIRQVMKSSGLQMKMKQRPEDALMS